MNILSKEKLAELVAILVATCQKLLFLCYPSVVNLLDVGEIYCRIVERSYKSEHICLWNLNILSLHLHCAGSHQCDGNHQGFNQSHLS